MHEFEMTTPRASLEDNVWSIQIMPEETIRKQIMSAGGGGVFFLRDGIHCDTGAKKYHT